MSLAPAVTRDGFSFAGDLFAEASGHNRHRRAAVSELKEHFKSGSDKDHPAHWFEAQLIHYGLQPSKTKSVARMRLFDAVNTGKLAVPSHIQRLEKDLKKEWIKNEREAKQSVKAGGPGPAASSAVAAGKKRKADSSNVDMKINVGGIDITVSANNASKSSSAAKKAKTTAAGTAPNKSKGSLKFKDTSASKPSKEKPKSKASTASKGKATTSASTPAKTNSTSKNSTKKETARRGGISQGPRRGSTSMTPAAAGGPGRTKQTARRSGAFGARGRIPTSGPLDPIGGFDEPPPPYREYDDYDSSIRSSNSSRYDRSDSYDSDRYSGKSPYNDADNYDGDRHSDSGGRGRYDSDGYDDPPSPPSLGPLGLLNGRYDIFSNEANDQWGCKDFDLVLTLSGRELWGKFDLGIIGGIMRFDERPWESSDDSVPFTWRGGEYDGPIFYDNDNHGWIRFLGNGRIEGELDHMRLDFGGVRLSGQGTRSQIDVQSMKREWNGYTEEEYERLNRARWG
ncbi:hypothetical protein F5Y01DRAFT_186622 [Xylaria sp. FL0043]|nr:hypothetical protein F5Y01DRAFT_186622 [Xylaria sp. FL0043]